MPVVAAAFVAGALSAFTDFRALREPILVMMVIAVALSAASLVRDKRGWRPFLTALALGPAAWAGAQVVYVLLQAIRGEPLEADRFGPQWAQALGLIGAHALFLGVPTGAAAGGLLFGWRRLRRRFAA